MENGHKNYVNQYAVHPIALNKPQRNEERDKKRHLSHKFSLTPVSEFKWLGGGLYATQQQIITTIRQTLLALEQAIVTPFMHHNWNRLRKVWINAIGVCTTPNEFARALCMFQTCLRGVVFASVWHEQLGHTKMYRITLAEREEKKKLEKREKRERDDEEERNRTAVNFVKYSLGLKHQVWKQKGEEYRIHGQWDWVWMGTGRRRKQTAGRTTNEAAHIVLPVLVPETHERKVQKLDWRSYEAFVNSRRPTQAGRKPVAVDFLTDIDSLNDKLLQKINQIETFEVPQHYSTEIDVSRALSTPQGRILYPKVGRKCPLLEGLLQRRLNLRDAEEQRIKLAKERQDEGLGEEPAVVSKADSAPSNTTVITVRVLPPSECIEKQLQRIVNSRATQAGQVGTVTIKPHVTAYQQHLRNRQYRERLQALVNQAQELRVRYHYANRAAARNPCYSISCSTASSPTTTSGCCYSSLCRQRVALRAKLFALLKQMQLMEIQHNSAVQSVAGGVTGAANASKSILEQKLTEAKKESFENLLTNFSVNLFKSLNDDLERSKRTLAEYDEALLAKLTANVAPKQESAGVTVKQETLDEVTGAADGPPATIMDCDDVVKEEVVCSSEDSALDSTNTAALLDVTTTPMIEDAKPPMDVVEDDVVGDISGVTPLNENSNSNSLSSEVSVGDGTRVTRGRGRSSRLAATKASEEANAAVVPKEHSAAATPPKPKEELGLAEGSKLELMVPRRPNRRFALPSRSTKK
uniref:Uncharacterized protein n=1 Tax=Anopheles maculatus TaxID=74869 RepID=A0A182TCM2_9DIPT